MKIKKINSVRGIKDYLPNDYILWEYIYNIIENILYSYGYKKIVLPIIEKTDLFKVSIEDDILVNKEMYSFKYKGKEDITFRPEGTSGCVRYIIKYGLSRNNQIQRFWYFGPMFRYERPQLGRYREFYQLGIESFGFCEPYIDVELILIINRLLKILKINNYIKLEINSIGSKEIRNKYCKDLVCYLNKNKSNLDNICIDQIKNNPLRILDTKNKIILDLLSKAPKLNEYLDLKSGIFFDKFKKILDYNNILYKVNPLLIRGLDYYNDIVFEWTTQELGSQSSICSGGRYDTLLYKLGGSNTFATGLAIGWNRLMILVKSLNLKTDLKSKIDIYLTLLNNNDKDYMIFFSEKVRNLIPNLKLTLDFNIRSLSKQIKKSIIFDSKLIIIIYDFYSNEKKFFFKNLNTNENNFLSENQILFKLKSLF